MPTERYNVLGHTKLVVILLSGFFLFGPSALAVQLVKSGSSGHAPVEFLQLLNACRLSSQPIPCESDDVKVRCNIQ